MTHLPRTLRRRWTAVPALAATAVLALACGSNNSNSNNNKPTTQSPTQAASAAATTASTSAATTAATAASSPSAAAKSGSGKVTKIVFAPNWFAEPENSGELMAKLLNYYPADLDVTIGNGGPSVNVTQELVSGQIQMGTCSADGLLIAKSQGIDLVGLMAAFQSNPQVLIAHKEQGIKSFADMKGKDIAVSDFANFFDYLANKYGWGQSQRVKYTGTLQDFLANKNQITQGYYTAEPFYIQAQGQQVDTFLIADSGMNPYASVLCTTKDFLQKNPDAVREFVQADQKGWLAMLDKKNDDTLFPEITKLNKDEQNDAMAYAISKMPDLMFNADSYANGFGHETADRYQQLMQQFIDTKVLKGPVDYQSVFTNDYLDTSIKGNPPTSTASPTPAH
jgi:NitT/TauT family transport system substrate-binding protein